MTNPSVVVCIVSEISAFIRTDGQTDMARSTPDQEYIYFMGSETLPSVCCILSYESSKPFYSIIKNVIFKHRRLFVKNKEERYSRVPRLSDTPYS